jgi:hypothetical protein
MWANALWLLLLGLCAELMNGLRMRGSSGCEIIGCSAVGTRSAISEDVIMCKVVVVIIDVIVDDCYGLWSSALSGVFVEIIMTRTRIPSVVVGNCGSKIRLVCRRRPYILWLPFQ